MKAIGETYELVSILGHPALFTSLRIESGSIPQGIYRYEIRHADDDGMQAAQLGVLIGVNHMGTLLTRFKLPLDENGFMDLSGNDLGFAGDGTWRLDDYLRRYPQPASCIDASAAVFEERLLGSTNKESVLFCPDMIKIGTAPQALQVLYAYENEAQDALVLYEGGKTIPVMPFRGTFIAVPNKESRLRLTRGQCTLALNDICAGRAGKIALHEYLRENKLPAKGQRPPASREPSR